MVARAKLTLSLRVLGRRPDGYHELEALVVSLREPHDVVGLRIQPPFGVRVRLSGRAVIGVPADDTNLAARAARLLLEVAADGEDPGPWAASGLDISLHKSIPAGSGLGGGSADAAGTLVGGARLLGLDLDAATLAALAVRLGSDVPFCVTGGIAWMRGRGEIIEPLPPPPGPWAGTPWPGETQPEETQPAGLSLVVAVPPFGLATPTVYRAWDELGGPSSTRPVPRPEGLAGLGLPDELVNDLEPAAEHVEPRLRPFREALERLAGGPALLGGSGSAYVVSVASGAEAAVLATQAGVELRAMAFATGLAARGVEAQRSPD